MGMVEQHREYGEQRSWAPPRHGECRCDGHVEDLLDLHIPRADRSGSVAVWAMVTSGILATVPVEPERRWVTRGDRRLGPFHWRVVAGDRLSEFRSRDAAVELGQSVAEQPGVDRALWLPEEGALAVGAPYLCTNGVQCVVALALFNPRVRS